jgi:multidrug efflux pump subunit AcrA (membrane-fusion protein)
MENIMNSHPIESDEVILTASNPMRMSGSKRRWTTILSLGGLALCGAAVVAGVLTGFIPNPLAHAAKEALATPNTEKVPNVKVVLPKRESSVPITVDQIATVEPYYRADLRARASGTVKSVLRDIGDKVKKGEVLVVIDVPESEQDVYRMDAMILQRQQELRVSDAKFKDAKAAKDVSAATIKQRLAEVEGAIATRDLKKRKYVRFQELAAKGSVVGSVVEEEERDYLSSEAVVTSTKANVERARADFAESESKIEAAGADIELKKAQVEVARKDLDRAKAVADYAKIVAPFDGVIVRRTVDPGSFVQNATTGSSEALISVAKVDLVSVTAKFPDAIAPSVTLDTPAIVTIDDLPGVSIPAKVTRMAPTVQNADHTMRVEVDLFNGNEDEYRRLSELVKTGGPDRQTKGISDPMPVRAFAADAPKSRRLIPGMTGTIRLTVGGFGDSYVLPTTAVYTRSGTSYILIVKDGKTKQLPVRVQVTDGKTVRLVILERQKSTDGSSRNFSTELTGQEQVVVARQLELGDGANVKAGPSDW